MSFKEEVLNTFQDQIPSSAWEYYQDSLVEGYLAELEHQETILYFEVYRFKDSTGYAYIAEYQQEAEKKTSYSSISLLDIQLAESVTKLKRPAVIWFDKIDTIRKAYFN